MEHDRICVGEDHGTCWEPIPAVQARLVTASDLEFVEQVRKDLKAPALKDARQVKKPSLDAPYAWVRCLEFELKKIGYILSSPPDQLPRVAVLAKPRGGRLQQLIADFERWLQQLPADYARFSSCTSFEDYLRKYLRGRFDVACAEICEGIANGRLEAKGVLLDGGKRHPAGPISASAITKDMKIGDDGLLYQGQYKHSPAWESVEVRAAAHLVWNPVVTRPDLNTPPEEAAPAIAAAKRKRNSRESNAPGSNSKGGRKRKYTDGQLAALRSLSFCILTFYGDPKSNNPHPECKSKTDLLSMLQERAVLKKPKDFPKEPARTTIQPYVDQWLEEWRRQSIDGD